MTETLDARAFATTCLGFQMTDKGRPVLGAAIRRWHAARPRR